jgi:hypothetical protein
MKGNVGPPLVPTTKVVNPALMIIPRWWWRTEYWE